MSRASVSQLLNQLDQLKLQFDPGASVRCIPLLKKIKEQHLTDAAEFIRLHEILLFLCAYPQSPAIVSAAEKLLREFPARLAEAEAEEADLAPLDHPEMSSIAGRSVIDTFSYYTVRWLMRRFGRQLAFYWDWFEDENRLAQTWPRFMPHLEEDAFVEANVPYRSWLKAARTGESELSWLINRFNTFPLTDAERAELYDSQQLYVQWTPPYRATRTGMRLPAKLAGSRTYYHDQPLLARRDVAFADELEKPPPPLTKLSNRDGEAVLDLAREASTVRYRELYGFTHGDPSRVFRADLGRGVELFVSGLSPEKRLPLRAYHAALIFKNRVPVGYFEGLSLFERMESGFNLYYTFRDGETAWLYARTLNVMRHMLGVTTFSLDPYQIGFENEEGIQSGAFWFYRKLGFRPTDSRLLEMAESEEFKIKSRPSYRTSAKTLRKLAVSPMVFELKEDHVGDWDRFQVRQIGITVQRIMSESFGGDAQRLRAAAVSFAEKHLGLNSRAFSKTQLKIFSDL
ncbi:MAG TPA: hypothetical protein VF074_11360, partial [Pyrinomonadaceae bacterium]